MAIPVVNVTINVIDQSNNPVRAALVTATLSRLDYYNDQLVDPIPQTTTTDNDGRAVLSVFPNTLGIVNSYYQFKAEDTDGQMIFKVNGVVPNNDVNLLDIIDVEPDVAAAGANLVAAAIASLRAELLSVLAGKGASMIGIEDALGNYTGINLEAVLAEIAPRLNTPSAGGAYALVFSRGKNSQYLTMGMV